MATKETTNMKWSRISDFLEEDSEIPTDIAFEIVDDVGTELGTVGAHKLILAAHSVFFRKAFFGTGLTFKEGTTGTVIVKETTKEAFLTMIDFIYERKINLANRTVEELFDILNISKRYQLDDLTLAINNHFKDFPFTLKRTDIWSLYRYPDPDILKVVAYAEEFEQFPDEKKSLFNRAVIFLKEKLTTTDEMLSFLDGTSFEHRDLAVRLLKEVKKLPCDECKRNPCQHGQSVGGAHQLKPGQLVRTSSTFLHENRPIDYEGLVCQVLRVNGNHVELHFLNPLSPSDKAVTLVEKGQIGQRGKVLTEVTNPFTWNLVSSHLLFICKKKIF